jgi:hypothetical protein
VRNEAPENALLTSHDLKKSERPPDQISTDDDIRGDRNDEQGRVHPGSHLATIFFPFVPRGTLAGNCSEMPEVRQLAELLIREQNLTDRDLGRVRVERAASGRSP